MDELESMIRAVHDGNTVVDSTLMRRILQPDDFRMNKASNLSPRELEILKLIATDLSYGQVAKCLGISLSTVKFHITNMLAKLNVETRNEAILVAAKNNFI